MHAPPAELNCQYQIELIIEVHYYDYDCTIVTLNISIWKN